MGRSNSKRRATVARWRGERTGLREFDCEGLLRALQRERLGEAQGGRRAQGGPRRGTWVGAWAVQGSPVTQSEALGCD